MCIPWTGNARSQATPKPEPAIRRSRGKALRRPPEHPSPAPYFFFPPPPHLGLTTGLKSCALPFCPVKSGDRAVGAFAEVGRS